MGRAACVLMLLVGFTSCAAAANEPVLGGPCENCELVFVEMPKSIASSGRIAPADEKGEPLVLEGTVRTSAGAPANGVIVYAYHTDASGLYPAGSTRHGRLRGWARTDENGVYRFETIRPGAYPSRNNPQHIHMHVIEPGRGTYWIEDVLFDDDPLLTKDRQEQASGAGRGGNGVCHPVRDAAGVWSVRRDITLGLNVPGYP